MEINGNLALLPGSMGIKQIVVFVGLVLLVGVWLDSMRPADIPAEVREAEEVLDPEPEVHGRGCSAAPPARIADGFPRVRPQPGQGAVFTPYHITPGGGEKYLLSSVAVLQGMGLFVTVYTRPENLCTSVAQLMQTAAKLRVQLDESMLDLKLWHPRAPEVEVFFVLGNEKFPQVPRLGRINILMCQFPFDLDRAMLAADAQLLSDFDLVFLNSRYSFNWYNHFATPFYIDATSQPDGMLFPMSAVMHPPVTLMPTSASRGERTGILLLGRFFQGRQSKGHAAAIHMFDKMRHALPAGTTLVLAGELVHDHAAYLEELHDLVRSLGLTDRVQLVASAPSEVINSYMMSSLVQWHLTGVSVDTEADPASREHFGISIVEGMYAGCIPICCQGGPEDIVTHGKNGFIAKGVDDVIHHTLAAFKLPQEQRAAMLTDAKRTATRFVYERFYDRFVDVVSHARSRLAHRHFVRETIPYLRACVSPTLSAAAMVIKPGSHVAVALELLPHYGTEFSLFNTLGHLSLSGLAWVPHVLHSESNHQFMQVVLSRMGRGQAVRAFSIETRNLGTLLSSPRFWKMYGNAETLLLYTSDVVLLTPDVQPLLGHDALVPHPCSNSTIAGAGSLGIGEVLPPLALFDPAAIADVCDKQHLKSLWSLANDTGRREAGLGRAASTVGGGALCYMGSCAGAVGISSTGKGPYAVSALPDADENEMSAVVLPMMERGLATLVEAFSSH